MSIARDIDTAQLGAVLKTALDAVVVMRTDGTIAAWNEVAEQTFGWSFAEAENQRMSAMIIPERYRAAHEAGLAHYLATGEGPVLDRHIEIEALHRDGHELPVELSITRTSEFGEPMFMGFLRDISERRGHERRQRLLVDELNHRVKNLLGVVGAVAHQTARSSTSLEQFIPAFNGRLSSLGRAHEILTAATWERASLGELVAATIDPFAADGRVHAAGPELTLSPRQFLSVSMILHELSTNALKYGVLASPGGSIDIAWAVEGDEVTLSWTERGGQHIAAPERFGFGSKMIALNVKHDLQGSSESRWDPDGLHFHLSFRRD